jgi:hypothetical protein
MAGTDEKPLDIVRLNIARYMRLLESETDPMTLTRLRTLLAEARNEETLIEEGAVFEKGKKQPVELREDARRWRMRAEEYRTVAGAIASEAARDTYRRLARSYEGLAERAELKAARQETDTPQRATDEERQRIREWCLKAAQLRSAAERMKDAAARLGMLNAAETYERLAEDAERGAKSLTERLG